MNRLQIIGHIGADATVRVVNTQSAISFNVAVTKKWKNAQGEQQQQTTWISCTLWRKPDQTAIAQYLKKGTQVLVEGEAAARAYANQAGEPQASLDLRVTEVKLLGSGNGQNQQAATPRQQAVATVFEQKNAANQQQAAPATFVPAGQDDDLPF